MARAQMFASAATYFFALRSQRQQWYRLLLNLSPTLRLWPLIPTPPSLFFPLLQLIFICKQTHLALDGKLLAGLKRGNATLKELLQAINLFVLLWVEVDVGRLSATIGWKHKAEVICKLPKFSVHAWDRCRDGGFGGCNHIRAHDKTYQHWLMSAPWHVFVQRSQLHEKAPVVDGQTWHWSSHD